jgi:hypothetical protein
MNIKSSISAGTSVLMALSVGMLILPSQVSASDLSISGTLSNFDTFNTTGSDSDGAELELEGVTSTEVTSHYPSHYVNIDKVEYDNGPGHTGTRIIFDDYEFDPPPLGDPITTLATSVPMSTNGHTCVDLPGCEHFGFFVSKQPTAVRFYWHDATGSRLNTEPLLVPSPSWVYIPPAVPADPPIVRAIVKVPEVEDPQEKADSIWMKVTVTESELHAELEDLISGGVYAGEIEVETEWELLEGGLNGDIEAEDDFEPEDVSRSVIRRYEYFQYTGAYSIGEHEPLSQWNGVGDPPANELGDFIAANMVAANLVPEPSTFLLVLTMLAGLGARFPLRN